MAKAGMLCADRTLKLMCHIQGKDKEGKSRDAKMKGESPPEPAAPIASSTPPKTPGGPSLKQATAGRAQRFVTQYFNTASGGLGLETEGVKLLRDICQDLDKPGALTRLLEVLHSSQSGDVSTFEFLSSGAVKQLRTYLLGMRCISLACRLQTQTSSPCRPLTAA